MEEVYVKKVELGGEADKKKRGKNGEHAKINAKNDAQFPTRVDFFRTVYYSYHGSILAGLSLTLSTKSAMGYGLLGSSFP